MRVWALIIIAGLIFLGFCIVRVQVGRWRKREFDRKVQQERDEWVDRMMKGDDP